MTARPFGPGIPAEIMNAPVAGLEPLGQLSPQDWMEWPETQKLMHVLCDGGVDARFVGGCVRDGILKKPVFDIDIATPDLPEIVMEKLNAAGIRVLPTGISHGTVTALINNRSFEITTLRRDVSTDGRHAEVAFTSDWIQDAKRRDFTINAMSADMLGRVYDPFDGLIDLGVGHVQFVGLAEQRIEEDVLRILRFFRFTALYGRGNPNRSAYAACRKLAAKLVELSGERIWQEMRKILLSPDPAGTLILMQNAGVLDVILPGWDHDRIGATRMLNWLESKGLARDDVTPDPVRHLAMLAPTSDVASLWAQRLKLSNQQSHRLHALLERIPQDISKAELAQKLYDWGPEITQDCLLMAWAEQRALADRPSTAQTAQWISLLDLIAQYLRPEFPLKGRDLDFVAPGPQMGAILTATQNWWRSQDFAPDFQACLAFAKSKAQGQAQP